MKQFDLDFLSQIVVFVEKDAKGNVDALPDVEIADVACGVNHTVSKATINN